MKITRRQALATAGHVAVATATIAAPAAVLAATDPDALLLALWEQLRVRRREWYAASRAHDAAHQKLPDGRHIAVTAAEAKRYGLMTPDFDRLDWTYTAGTWARDEIESARRASRVVVCAVNHRDEERALARLARHDRDTGELLARFDDLARERERMKIELGIPELEAAIEAADEREKETREAILTTPAHGLTGLLVKARVLLDLGYHLDSEEAAPFIADLDRLAPVALSTLQG